MFIFDFFISCVTNSNTTSTN